MHCNAANISGSIKELIMQKKKNTGNLTGKYFSELRTHNAITWVAGRGSVLAIRVRQAGRSAAIGSYHKGWPGSGSGKAALKRGLGLNTVRAGFGGWPGRSLRVLCLSARFGKRHGFAGRG